MAADKEKGATGSASAEIDKYLALLAKDPNSRVFAPLAEAYRKAGFLDDAIEIALEGLKVHPNYLGGRVALGRAYHDKKLFAEARAEMEKVVKTAPDNLMAHKLLGQIAHEQSDLPGAERAFRMVLLLDPRDLEAKQFLDALGGGSTPREPAPRIVTPPAPAPGAPKPAPPAPTPSPATATASVPPPPRPIPPAAVEESLPPEGLDLRPVETIEELAFPELAASEIPLPAAAPVLVEPEELSVEEISLESATGLGEAVPEPIFEFPAPEGGKTSAPEAPASMEAAVVEAPTAEEPPPPTAEEPPSFEVFSRQPWESATHAGRETPPPSAVEQPAEALHEIELEPTSHAPVEGVSPAVQESPFEVFGRPKRSGPPVSTKGEQEAFKEIELESTSFEPVAETVPAEESPFEIFTRVPREEIPPGPPASEPRREGGGFRDIELEPTAPPEIEVFAAAEVSAPVNLEEEIPRIDLAQEVEIGRAEEGVSTPPALPEPEAVPVPMEEPAAEIPFTEVLEPPPVSLEEEIPRIDLAQEVELPPLEVPPPEAAAPAAARGVFDTETLASIYINQGFYGRAADIYRRLVQERPGDEVLRQKLEEVAAMERAPGAPGIVTEPEARPAAVRLEPAPQPALDEGNETIRRLQILLESLKGGRPR